MRNERIMNLLLCMVSSIVAELLFQRNELLILLQEILKVILNDFSVKILKPRLSVSSLPTQLTAAQFDLHVAMGASAALIKYLGVVSRPTNLIIVDVRRVEFRSIYSLST